MTFLDRKGDRGGTTLLFSLLVLTDSSCLAAFRSARGLLLSKGAESIARGSLSGISSLILGASLFSGKAGGGGSAGTS